MDKKEICRMHLPNMKKMLARLFVDDSFLFLKVESNNLKQVLEILQLFNKALGSQCNIEKSRLISLTKSGGFDYARWIGEEVRKEKIF